MADDLYMKSMEDNRILGPFITDKKDSKTMEDHLKELSITGRSTSAHQQQQQHVTGRTILFATLASVAIGGPLLGMMGFTLLASITVLLLSSPLLLIFSPLLIPAVLVLGAVMVGFAVAAVMAVAGLSVFAWSYRMSVKGRRIEGEVGEQTVDTLTESGQRVKEIVNEWDRNLQQKVLQVSPPAPQPAPPNAPAPEQKNKDKSKGN